MQKKNGFSILALNAKFHDVPAEWVNIAAFASDEVYPDTGTYIYSIPVNNDSVIFQIMLQGGNKYIQGRCIGETTSILVVQETLIWFTQ